MEEIYQSDKSLNNSYNSSITLQHIKQDDVELKITLFKSNKPTKIFIMKIDTEEKVIMTIKIGDEPESNISIEAKSFLTFYSSLKNGFLLNIE